MTKSLTRLVQIKHPLQGRKVALVEEPLLRLIAVTSIYQLCQEAVEKEVKLTSLIEQNATTDSLKYDDVYLGRSDWKLMIPFDHPKHPECCLISGTGLTHQNSALGREAMHIKDSGELTDSMEMYLWGIEKGRPPKGKAGVQPEWFYKGNGVNLRAHNEYLSVPGFALDGGEEPEIAGVYFVDSSGKPWRIGLCTGNEFSDHIMERQNYLYLAHSKLRNCAIGPELVLGHEFQDVRGDVSILRQGKEAWSKKIRTGEQNMSHSVANLEHHHFKYTDHRLPNWIHVHFFGADSFSFSNNFTLKDGDVMRIKWEGMGRPLLNTLRIEPQAQQPEQIKDLG